MHAFCPRCGEETGGIGPRGLCQDCYLEENALLNLPDETTVERCRHCGRVKIRMDWREAETDQDLIYHVLDTLIDDDEAVTAVTFEPGDGYDVTVLVEQTVEGAVLQDEVTTHITIEHDQCPPCSKFHGGYYAYKLQLRGSRLDDALERMMEKAGELTAKDRDNFVSSVEEVDGGYDIYVSSRAMADQLIKTVKERYDVETTRSKELLGEEEGQRVYRSIVSIRIV